MDARLAMYSDYDSVVDSLNQTQVCVSLYFYLSLFLLALHFLRFGRLFHAFILYSST